MQIMTKLDFKKIRPRIYKKTLMIGNVKLFKFTKEYTKKFFHKALWLVLIISMILGMVLGGLGIMMSKGN